MAQAELTANDLQPVVTVGDSQSQSNEGLTSAVFPDTIHDTSINMCVPSQSILMRSASNVSITDAQEQEANDDLPTQNESDPDM
eukprot:828234-Karenia_brevis.AAC.1